MGEGNRSGMDSFHCRIEGVGVDAQGDLAGSGGHFGQEAARMKNPDSCASIR